MDLPLEQVPDSRGAPYDTITPVPGQIEPPPKRQLFTLSPINRRRWRNFRAHKRGFWSLWIFLVLFVISLIAGLVTGRSPTV